MLPPPSGQAEYTTPGTYSWTAPAGVNFVSVVCVGGGGGGWKVYGTPFGTNSGGGGSGGGLGWKNNIAVAPGQTYTVVVGAAGTSVLQAYNGSTSGLTAGGDSYFISNTLVLGGGGPACIDTNNYSPGGTHIGDGGGDGGSTANGRAWACGGGGAGGYTGNGGDGGRGYGFNPAVVGTGSNGSGGGGGGGASYYTSIYAYTASYSGGAGGGVGIYGQGSNGTGATSALASGTAGSGGSGKTYGGGAGGSGSDTAGGGAVRIIWGANRAFPSTNTADV